MKNKKCNELAVCGMDAVKALERSRPESIRRLYFTAEKSVCFGGLCKKLAAHKIPYNCVQHSSELEKLCGSVHHQGVVAMIQQHDIPFASDTLANECLQNKETLLILDCIGNANNFGAIVRSAAFFGIRTVIIPMDDAQSTINTASYRVAQGGMECVHVYKVASVTQFLQSIKGKYCRVGTDSHSKTALHQLSTANRENKPIALVLGNEEKGMSEESKKCCDIVLCIEAKGFFTDKDGQKKNAVESLNVAQSAAVLLYYITAG
ncbi:MAG: RNA methyltransferase [Spirochaetales bacterium]